MPPKLEKKLRDDNFITWVQYSNIAGIVATALMIAAAFYGVKMQLAVLTEKTANHIEQSAEEKQASADIIRMLNDHEKRISTLETLEGIKGGAK